MRRIVRSVLLFWVALALIIARSPVKVFSDDNVYYIRNNYSAGAYLYEADGVLRYGIPITGDTQFQWLLEEKGGSRIIKNLATGHCITLEGHADETVEGYWGDVVACLDYEEGNDTFLWSVTAGNAQNIVSDSKKYTGYALHLENVTNGQVSGQKLSDDQLNWGNMKWDFIKEKDINFISMIRDGFCIQNEETGTFLKADNGKLIYGTPEGPDSSYIWTFDQQDGKKAIKNKLTGEYIVPANGENIDSARLSKDIKAGDNYFLWSFQVSRETTILSASPDAAGYGLSPANPDMKWNIVSATDVPGVAGPLILEEGVYNLKNSWFALYMIEDNGTAVYGNAKPTDPNAQWRFIFDEATGLTAIKNEGTGHYLHMNNRRQLVCDNNESYYWKLNRNKNLSYPNAVQFQDSLDSKCYLHMESLSGVIENSGAVQPSWGTPHWEPIKVTNSTSDNSADNIDFVSPSGFIRLQSAANPGEYLYENASGALLYGDCKADDARSHWEIIKTDADGSFLIKNREYENYISGKSNGTTRCVDESRISPEEAHWEISAGDSNVLVFSSANPKKKSYQKPYLNIRKLSGTAQCSLVSTEEATTQWLYETAPDTAASAEIREEILVPVNIYPDTNLYRVSYDGQLLKSLYKLEYIGSKVRVLDTSENKYLYFAEGLKTKTPESNYDLSVQWERDSKAGVFTLKQNKTRIQLEKVPSDAAYESKNAYSYKNLISFTVYAEKTGDYKAGIGYSGLKVNAELKVNGISRGKVILPSKEKISVHLNKGINTISISGADNGITGITLHDSINKEYRGASVPFREYEAEDCVTTGTLIEDDRNYRTLSSEASGRLAVNLDGTGQYVKFTLAAPANALVVRYCIPDSKDGSGLDASLNLYIDGIKTKSLELTSKYSWVYGGYPWTNNPADGQAHHFYDEIRVMLDKTYPVGTVIKLQKDAANQAEYYILDLVEAEEVDSARKQAENSLSVTEFGAVPNDGVDDTKAIFDCIKAANEQGREVWIPEGIFEINTPTKNYDAGDKQDKNRGFVLTEDNTTIRGAGMWHTILKGEYAAFFIKANHIAFYDFTLSGNAASRRDAIDPSAIETDYNTPQMENVILQNVWIEHYKTGVWTHNLNGLHVAGCRIRNTFADGMNLRRGTSNSVVEQCSVRNTGDDAIALWSSDFSDTNNSIRFNTVSLQWLANNIALYGGTDIEVVDNVIKDTVGMGGGVNISSNFNPEPFAGTILIARNTLERCGSFNANYNMNSGAIWFNTVSENDNHAKVIVRDNVILDSTHQGISFMNKGTADNVLLEGNIIDGCSSYGIDISAGAKGSATIRNNVIHNAMLGEINNGSEDKFALVIETTKMNPPVLHEGKIPVLAMIASMSVLIAGMVTTTVFYLKRKKAQATE